MPRIAIVTDSTADMPLSFYEENDVEMVPLVVRFGNKSYKDWVEMPPETFYGLLRESEVLPKTSQPSVQEFIEAYKRHSDCDHIISIHISAKLSGTFQSAYIASQNVDLPVTVIDSKNASAGLGLIVKSLVQARSEGKGAGQMISIAERMANSIKDIFYVDTLKYLEMGGRIGKATALAGSILKIKPILTLDDGIVAPLRKVKGRKRAVSEIVSLVKAFCEGRRVNIGLAHADISSAIDEIELALKEADINSNVVIKSQIGSVIGTYVGPDAFAILVYKDDILADLPFF
ncbi:MAG: DegV family protein [Firmicutes bacterium]|nr:DegV family protein [Bacillota bacterium]